MYRWETISRSELKLSDSKSFADRVVILGRVARRTTLTLLTMLVMVSAATVLSISLPSATASAQDNALAYRLDSGDKVKITVFGHEDLSGEFEVDPQGKVSMPLIQYVQAQGLTPQEFEAEIVGALAPDYLKNPTVTVEVLTSKPFYILGEVENPGSYDYVSGLTILESVALAGGFTYRAKQKKMTIVRATDPEKRKIAATVETRVLPGDVIEIPERRW